MNWEARVTQGRPTLPQILVPNVPRWAMGIASLRYLKLHYLTGPNTPILGSLRKHTSANNTLSPQWRAVPYISYSQEGRACVAERDGQSWLFFSKKKPLFFPPSLSLFYNVTAGYIFYFSSLFIEDYIFPQSMAAELKLSMRTRLKFKFCLECSVVLDIASV